MANNIEEKIDRYSSEICLPNGKTYKLRCEVVEIYPMTCRKYGGQLKLKYESGICPFCGTTYTTQIKVEEVK